MAHWYSPFWKLNTSRKRSRVQTLVVYRWDFCHCVQGLCHFELDFTLCLPLGLSDWVCLLGAACRAFICSFITQWVSSYGYLPGIMAPNPQKESECFGKPCSQKNVMPSLCGWKFAMRNMHSNYPKKIIQWGLFLSVRVGHLVSMDDASLPLVIETHTLHYISQGGMPY